MTRLLLVSFVSLFLAGAASAQDMNMMGMDMFAAKEGDSAATKGYKDAMLTMMNSSPAFTGEADVDFMKQMKVHHRAAIDMAKVLLANGKDAETRKVAEDVIKTNEAEIATLQEWLKKQGQ